MLALFVKVLTM